ncbi:MACPF domain-containing protein CAD1-like [Zingiber officinale]|uniref:MACPF domain-containing protein CAD1-like n=1 Tax=Zingiber officinale TaxID=94328 RepID=UPI001C4D7C3B|nr:MACPF domain-containing protein CAD1-like [Zingiber officinale]
MDRARGASAAAGGSEALVATLTNAVQALGRGFDVTLDARLLYCKGAPGSRLVVLDDASSRSLVIADGDCAGGEIVLPDVPLDITITMESDRREPSGVCTFQQMAEYFNRKSDLPGTIPLGSFNSMFNFTGSWKVDAATTKALAMDGFYIPLYKAKLISDELVLRDDIKCAIPRNWDPSMLASFIENFGTHIITSVTIGGKDEVYIKQHHSSQLSESEIKNYVKEIGDQRFLNSQNQSFNAPLTYKDKDITVIFRRRGGDDLVQNHAEWLSTISAAPDVINMTFLPIVSLLTGLPGAQNLVRAVDLYLEYKPPIEELTYFLEFQVQRIWAPARVNAPGHHRKEPMCPSLQFSLMGPKLYISTEQVSVGRKPVTGLRLSLEGSKQNRLAIHLQHFATLPKILLPHWDSHVAIGPPKWQGPEEQDSRWFEPIKWKNFAHVSTTPIESSERSIVDLSGVYIVTGAQLGVWDFGAKSVLHLKLLFSRVPGCTIRRSVWDHSPSTSQVRKVEDTSSSTSVDNSKLAKIVDMTEMLKGPQDTPGHWLVTGAKLGVEKGKIVARVKYSLLNY